MIKKLFCITLLIILIVANISVCYADTNGVYNYDVYNRNISDVGSGIYLSADDLDALTRMKQNLLDDYSFSPYLSRYNSGVVNLHLDINVFMRPQYLLVGNINNPKLPVSPNYTIQSDYINILSQNITYSNYSVSSGYDTNDLYYFYYSYNMVVDIRCNLRDLIFTQDADYTQNLIYLVDNTSQYGFYLYNNNGSVVGYLVRQYFRTGMGATMSFTLENNITGVNGGCMGFNFYQKENYTNTIGFKNYGVHQKQRFNYTTTEAPDKSFLGQYFYYTMTNKSLIVSMNMKCDSNDWSTLEDNYYSVYSSAPNLSQNQTQFDLVLSILPPLFLTDDEPVNNIYSDNQTHIDIPYYDAKWYEIHKQLANAFIFLVTEFPLISDITNLIYSLFIMIQNGFNVLLEFDGFGILFAFGMFAIVFGFIYKLIVGD